jgi:hypothetical protein
MHMKNSLRILTALLLLAGFQTVAKQGEAPENKGERFAKRDTNGDGQLSLDEFKAGMPADKAEKAAAIFAKIDTNSDGALSKDELKAGHDMRKGKGDKGKGKGGCDKGECDGKGPGQGKGKGGAGGV